jgi:hypothetical protein
MLAQGDTPINGAYFAALNAKLNGVGSCEELQAVTDEIMASLGAFKAAMTSELAQVTPLIALLSAPGANPTAIVTWITDFITYFLTPMTAPYTVYSEQLLGLTAQVATLTATVASKQAEFPSCSVTVPTI